jgi:hypothetical protein
MQDLLFMDYLEAWDSSEGTTMDSASVKKMPLMYE